MTFKNAQNEDRNPVIREHMVNHILRRLNDDPVISSRRRNFKNSKLYNQGLTEEEIAEKQRKLFENVVLDEESEDPFNGDGNHETEGNGQAANGQMDEATQYWLEYKANWISHNKPVLEQEYANWV